MKRLILILFSLALHAEVIDFNLYKMENNPQNKPTLLILSGIQGDEPGAFNAVSLLIKHYKITNGSVWLVPNLNQHSILKNNRGIYGDMNRKFARLDKTDPEYKIVERIKNLILSPNVATILHLHDGSGFYREYYINNLYNQYRWGNCSIIDQSTLFYDNDLNDQVLDIVSHINDNLLSELHRYRVRNTNTKDGDKEQEKSLTYFATTNKKMAFANEASKNLPLKERVYYHLLAIEGMFKSLDIEFERDFELDSNNINELINNKNINLVINDIIELPLYNLKKELNFFPIPRDFKQNLRFNSNTPIVWLFKENNVFNIKNGNRAITTLNPFYTDFDYSLQNVSLLIDDEEVNIPIGTSIKAKNSFLINALPYRVNVIGFKRENIISEENIKIKKDDLIPKFAIDARNTKFRVEFYKQNVGQKDKFAGMIIIEFE